MPGEGDFASPRPPLASPVPGFLIVPGTTGGGIIGEHGFPLSRKVGWGFPGAAADQRKAAAIRYSSLPTLIRSA